MEKGSVGVWKKRITAAKDLYKKWEEEQRVKECYNYWRGDQLADPLDEFGRRRAQINKIHPEVRNNIPSIYFYKPFARLNAAPEATDDPGSTIEQDVQLLQDTVNHLIRDPRTTYREATFIGLKEAHWAMAVVEVGYTAEFEDDPGLKRPALKEKKDTKVAKPLKEEAPLLQPDAPPGPFPPLGGEAPIDMGTGIPDPMAALGMAAPPPEPIPGIDTPIEIPEPAMGDDLASIQAEIASLKAGIREEKFFVKHIPSKQLLVSISDMPIIQSNDWIGYWEDVNLEDVKESAAYKNTAGLKPNTGDPEKDKEEASYSEATGGTDKVRLYKIWDLRTYEKWVFAEGHDKELMRKKFKRLPLKILRFDIDPYHFYPRPPLLSKLGPQDEYNESREYLRKIRLGTVPRYTYDEDAVEAVQLRKLESGEMGTYVPRKSGTTNVFEPIQQPSYSENAIQTLTLSDKEFADVGGVGGDARTSQSKTATQAKIAETKDQVQDSFDRQVVAEWLASIAEELMYCAIDNMNMDQWVAINVVPETMYASQFTQQIEQTYKRINAEILSDAQAGVRWSVIIDVESLSPVSEEEKFQKWMQGLSLFGNPPMARLFSASPELLIHTLNLLGVKSSKDQQMIVGAMQQVVAMEQQLAAQGQNAAPGMSGQPGAGKPPAPKGPGGPPGGPQPGPPGPKSAPSGPGASAPKL